MNLDHYEVRAFYRDDAPPPFEPGGEAFHTWNRGDFSRDLEIRAAFSRKEIGRVEWRQRTGFYVFGAWRPAERKTR